MGPVACVQTQRLLQRQMPTAADGSDILAAMRKTAHAVLSALLLAALLPAQPALGQETSPAIREVTVTTNRERNARFERSRILPIFDSTVPADASWRDAARAFVDDGCGTLAAEHGSKPYSDLALRGLAMTGLKCDDPVVLCISAIALDAIDDPRAARAAQLAWEAMAESKYPAYRRALAGVLAAKYRPADDGGDEGLNDFWTKVINLYVEAHSEIDLDAVDMSYVFAKVWPRIRSEFKIAVAEELVRRLDETPAVNRWVANMARGHLQMRLAWEARGSGYANTVTPEGWAAFAHHQQQAAQCFRAAHELQPGLPNAATEMISVAMAGHSAPGEDERFWFDRAVWAQIDYWPAYEKYIWSLRPRWGGSHSAMIRFGLECARTGRYDTAVPGYLLKVLVDIASELKDYQQVFRHPGVYEALREVLTSLAATQPENENYELSLLSAIAWRAGRHDDARRYLEGRGPRFDRDAAWVVRARLGEMFYDIYTYATPAGELFRRADEAAEIGDWAGAKELCEQAAQVNAKGDPNERRSSQSRAAAARFRADFESGDWVSLRFGPEFAGWQTVRTGWQSPAENVLVARPNAGTQIVSRELVGNRLELRGKFESKPDEIGPALNGSVIFGYDVEGGDKSDRWRAVHFNRAASTVEIKLGNLSRVHVSTPVEFRPVNEFYIRVDGDDVLVHFNGNKVYQGEWPQYGGGPWKPGERFGFAALRENPGRGEPRELHFFDVEVRKLPPRVRGRSFNPDVRF
jgi:hypothetical protein